MRAESNTFDGESGQHIHLDPYLVPIRSMDAVWSAEQSGKLKSENGHTEDFGRGANLEENHNKTEPDTEFSVVSDSLRCSRPHDSQDNRVQAATKFASSYQHASREQNECHRRCARDLHLTGDRQLLH